MAEELSLWDRFKIAITPVSHAESVVDAIYSPENRGMSGLPGFSPLPDFETESAGTPDFIVKTKQAATATVAAAAEPFKQAAASITGTLKKYAIIGFAGIALLVILYAIAGALIRR